MSLPLWKYSVSYAEVSPPTAPIPLVGSIGQALETAAAIGYDAIEFHTPENAHLDIESLKMLSEKSGVRIQSVVTGRLYTEGQCSLLDDCLYSSERALSGMKHYIKIAAELGANVVIGWAKGNVPPHGSREKYLDRLALLLKELNAYAKEFGDVKLFLEAINRYEVNIFTTAKETYDFLIANKLDNCYVHLDTFHMGLEETDFSKAFEYCKDRLGYIHVADNTRLYPGSGNFDFKKILSILHEIGYDGYINVECNSHADRRETMEKALKHLKASEPNL